MKMSDDYTDKMIYQNCQNVYLFLFAYTMVFNNGISLASIFINILK